MEPERSSGDAYPGDGLSDRRHLCLPVEPQGQECWAQFVVDLYLFGAGISSRRVPVMRGTTCQHPTDRRSRGSGGSA